MWAWTSTFQVPTYSPLAIFIFAVRRVKRLSSSKELLKTKSCLLGSNFMYFDGWVPAFRRNVFPPSAEYKGKSRGKKNGEDLLKSTPGPGLAAYRWPRRRYCEIFRVSSSIRWFRRGQYFVKWLYWSLLEKSTFEYASNTEWLPR